MHGVKDCRNDKDVQIRKYVPTIENVHNVSNVPAVQYDAAIPIFLDVSNVPYVYAATNIEKPFGYSKTSLFELRDS